MPAKPPFEFLNPALRVLLFWAGVALVGFGAVTIDRLQQPDLEACRQHGECVRISQLDLELAWSEPAFAAATRWSEATRKRAIESLRADSWILVPGYVLILGIACGAAARRGDQRTYGRLGVAVTWLIFVAGAADLAENTLIAMALDTVTATILNALAVAASLKWFLFAIALLYATLAPLSRWIYARR